MGMFIKYLQTPNYLKNEKIQWGLILELFLFYYLVSIPLSIFIGFILKFMDFSETEINLGTFKMIFVGIIFVPIFEEILFRLLLKPKFYNFILFFFLTAGMMIFFFYKSNHKFFFFFLFLSLLSLVFIQNKRFLRMAQVFVIRHFSLVFYSSCILFGFYHITNYSPINYKLILMMPLIVLPQMIGGTFMGFIRIKFGIIYSILFHAVSNVLPILILIIT
jgi:uncharacterized protein